jgi:hypothetical protein
VAAPTLVQSGTGVVTATGTGTASLTGATIGNVIICHVLIDAATGTVNEPGGTSTFENLAGTDNSLTQVGTNQQAGNPIAARQRVWIGRALATTVNVNIALASGDDIYWRLYEFSGVHTGTTLADVIENSTAGSNVNGFGTSTSVLDTGVTTLGADRLALNLVGINDDATGIAAFTGMSGGTWDMPSSFESATGTDGTIALMTATIASAGTIDGGSAAITSDAWGVVGFALIPAAAGVTPLARPINTELQAVSRSSVY